MNGGQRWERQRWSLAHEYAHFLTRRDRAEVTVSLTSYQRVPPSERFADAFARNMLLPRAGLGRRWESITAGQAATVATLLSQADRWGVSLQAFVLRLEGLKLVKPGTYDGLLLQGLAVDEARSVLGLPERRPDTQVVGRRMRLLAVTAYAQGQLSEERLARILRVDRLEARQIASSLLTGLSKEP
jgi:Zn-dependent peptidase ImmA (M78 family)